MSKLHCGSQVDQSKLERLREAAASKASRLEAEKSKLQELQDRVSATQQELTQLQEQLVVKKKEATAAQAEHRKIRCGGLGVTGHVCFISSFLESLVARVVLCHHVCCACKSCAAASDGL